jgi:histidine phosphotransferase ChpT
MIQQLAAALGGGVQYHVSSDTLVLGAMLPTT